jgi:hypothetical protein
MATWLKQSTAVDIKMGPFLDATDGVTAETALTITQADIRLAKNGGSWAQKNAAQTLTHEENGWYEVALDTTDTNTLGILIVNISESGALPVWREFLVMPANTYDSLVSSSDVLTADVTQFGGTNATSSGGRPEVNTTHAAGTAWGSGAITAPSIDTGAITSAKFASSAINSTVLGNGCITSAELDASAITAIQAGLSTLVVADIRTALGLASANLDTQLAAIDDLLDTEIAAIKAKTDLIPGTLDGLTFAQSVMLWNAVLLGKASGLGTATAVYRSPDDGENRVTATVDADGNRSAITLNTA